MIAGVHKDLDQAVGNLVWDTRVEVEKAFRLVVV